MRNVNIDEVLIIILDDDMDEAEEISMLLKQNGYPNNITFTVSMKLLENIPQNGRIFIIDYRLDKFNGLEVIEKIKAMVPHCYFIMLSGMKNYSIIEQFNNTVLRGKYITKGEPDTSSRILKFIGDFIEDMKMMKAFYQKYDDIQNNIDDIKKITKGGK